MALYNKYRPKSLDEACGQDLVRQALKNQVASNDMVHSYLFVGPAGTGKTTIARILAAMVNCSTGMTVNPPADDRFVSSILEGKFGTDVVEMDAASENGINDIRDLRQKAYYGPIEMRKKIYIIDECHQLTQQAWQALLKIVEEPPEHVMFIFCTTDPTKIPPTILTRVQQYSFSPLPLQKIIDTVLRVSKLEGIVIEDDAAKALAASAGGSMRQALTTLEKMKALGGAVTLDRVAALVGGMSMKSHARDFLYAVISSKFVDSMVASSQVVGRGAKADTFVAEVAKCLHDVLVCKNYDLESAGYSADEAAELKKLRAAFDSKLQDGRAMVAFITEAVTELQECYSMTVFNSHPQCVADLAYAKLLKVYLRTPKKQQ